MTKYQEKCFKDYVRTIEDLTGDYRDSLKLEHYHRIMETDEIRRLFKEIKKVRIEFFNWFKKQINK